MRIDACGAIQRTVRARGGRSPHQVSSTPTLTTAQRSYGCRHAPTPCPFHPPARCGLPRRATLMQSTERRAFEALRVPGFAAYLVTFMLTMMADNIEHVISYWVAFQKFHSPALGGFAVVSHWLPYLAVLGRGRRAQRSLRFAADHPDRRRAVHVRVDRLGLLLPHRHAADVARDGAAGAARLRRRPVDHVEPDVALRHRRAGRAAERGAPERDGALPGDASSARSSAA